MCLQFSSVNILEHILLVPLHSIRTNTLSYTCGVYLSSWVLMPWGAVAGRVLEDFKQNVWSGVVDYYHINFLFVKLHENPNIMLQSELAVFVGSTNWLLQFMILVIILKIHMLILCVIWSIFEKEKEPENHRNRKLNSSKAEYFGRMGVWSSNFYFWGVKYCWFHGIIKRGQDSSHGRGWFKFSHSLKLGVVPL